MTSLNSSPLIMLMVNYWGLITVLLAISHAGMASVMLPTRQNLRNSPESGLQTLLSKGKLVSGLSVGWLPVTSRIRRYIEESEARVPFRGRQGGQDRGELQE